MKIKTLTMAVATASMLASTGVFAAADEYVALTAPTNIKLGLELYGLFEDNSIKGSQESSSPGSFSDINNSTTDFSGDKLRLSLEAAVKEDVTMGLEAEWDIDTGGSGGSNTVINEAWMSRVFGATVVTGGRFKGLADRADYVEKSDRLFTYDSGSTLGASRRIDGLGVRWGSDTGFNASANFYKSGQDSQTTVTSGVIKTDNDLNFGYSGSVGFQLGGTADNGLTFGTAFSVFDEQQDESATTSFRNGMDRMGYSLEGYGKLGAFVGGISYGDDESDSFTSNINGSNRVTVKKESDTLSTWGAWNLWNAERNFDSFGVLQGPKLKAGQYGGELVWRLGQTDYERTNSNSSSVDEFKSDAFFYSIGYNFYCGQYSKWNLSYSSNELEYDAGSAFSSGLRDLETDQFTLGIRLDF